MGDSPISDLIDILIPLSTGTALFLLVAIVPWACVVLFRKIFGKTNLLYTTVFWAAIVATALAITKLLIPGPAAGLSPTGMWYLMFLYGFIPLWIIFALIIGVILLISAKFKINT